MENLFERTIDKYYKSLGETINNRKKKLKLKREYILNDVKRVTYIVNGYHDEHHPYLIGKSEYDILYGLFLSDRQIAFFDNKDVAISEPKKFKKKISGNYDKMLWGHIDWDMMLRDTIDTLSQMDISTDLGKLFDETLIDDVLYAVNKYDELAPGCAVVWIPAEERAEIRKKAIERVHLRCGHERFKKIFMDNFSGKTLDKFDRYFAEFVKTYLEQKKPDQYSFGLQAYNLCKNISGFKAKWYSSEKVQYANVKKNTGEEEEKTESEKFLEDYIHDGQIQIDKLKEYQNRFDSLEKLEIR